jgi:UDP:flavonoid glycosyltransferase YjiC (YdhE family)
MYSPGIEMIVLALAGLNKIPVDIHVSGATTSLRRFLEQQPNVTFWADHKALLEHAKGASALLHHGVQDVTQHCISLGRPQLLIPWTREQELLNYMVAWMSFSWMKPTTISVDEMAMTCRDLLRDASLVVAAQHYARQLAETDIDDALPGIIRSIEERARLNQP